MMPTPEQEARLKRCKSSAEYDAEWERITNENLKTMTERTAAEIRALREQEYDLWITNQQIARQDSQPVKSSIVRSDEANEYEILRGIEYEEAERRNADPSYTNTEPIGDKTIVVLTLGAIFVGTVALLISVLKK